MKYIMIFTGIAAIALPLYEFASIVRRASDDLDSIERNTSIIRATLAPTPMRATVVLPEESPKDIQL